MEFIYFLTSDVVAERRAFELLPEGRHYAIDKKWSVRVDNPHTTGMQKHSHVQAKGQEIAVVNQDGTPSHGSDLSKLPNWVLSKAKDFLKESFLEPERVPASVIAYAVSHEEGMTRAAKIL